MSAKIIDGKAIAAEIREGIARDVEKLVASGGPRPGLATVLVGENPASQTYVRMKRKACDELGIDSYGYELEATASQ
jgi:methylenetetrahydrofolate dehydrogenase (NADP+)/methenyltetrahydrofolate cyclohydrolase